MWIAAWARHQGMVSEGLASRQAARRFALIRCPTESIVACGPGRVHFLAWSADRQAQSRQGRQRLAWGRKSQERAGMRDKQPRQGGR